MRFRRNTKADGYYIPEPSSHWTFNESASPSYDKGGISNFTYTGSNTFNGDSVTNGAFSGVFNNTAGVYGKLSRFSMFAIIKPNATDPDSDILAVGSGSGFTADDYTWYLDTNSTSNGFKLGIAPGGGDYGVQVEVNLGSIDTTKKHWFFFGYDDSPSSNNGFLFIKREGDANVYSNTSITMSAYVTGRSHYLANTAYFAGSSISCTYYRALYWENMYLQDLTMFQRLTERYAN